MFKCLHKFLLKKNGEKKIIALIKIIFKSLIGISIVLVLSIVAFFVLFGMDSSDSETNNVEIDDAGLEASSKETPIEPSTNDQDSPSTSTWQDVVSWEGALI